MMETTRSNMIKLEYVTSDNFREEVTDSDIPVVVWFKGSWCGQCQAIFPMISNTAEELQDEIKFVCIDCPLDINPEDHWLMAPLKVQRVPAFMFIKNGTVYGGHEGGLNEEQLDQLITKNIRQK